MKFCESASCLLQNKGGGKNFRALRGDSAALQPIMLAPLSKLSSAAACRADFIV